MVSYDPYDIEINADPYPVFAQLREEAPLYYNEEYDFFAVSRYDDVERGLLDRETYISSRGGILELIKANIEMPSGVVIFEDPPLHTVHRGLLSRVFTPKKMNALEPQVREFCAASLDPLVGTGHLDFIADLGAQMPMRVIGMLLGIPEEDQAAIRDQVDANIRTEAGKPMTTDPNDVLSGDMFGDYIDWRAKHPSDDLMTEMLNAEFEDEHGVTRKLTRDEILIYVTVIAGAGNETTTRLIGWAGKVLAEHPDQRREFVADPALIPNAIEELLRFEPPAPHVARYVDRDVELYGETVKEGNVMMLLVGAANRDDRRYPNGDQFDIHRTIGSHLTFGFGTHFCLGAALARLEGRIALEELLKRFPTWDVDLANAQLSPTSTVRGWETLPGLHAMTAPEPTRQRRRYDSPIRREQTIATRERIVTAGAELLHGFAVWNWRALTVRGVAKRAGVNERTVYRHFANEQELREAVLERLESDAGVALEGLQLEDIADHTKRILEYVSTFPLEPRLPLVATLSNVHRRQREALLAAVADPARTWTDADRTVAAGMLDVLWSVASYERLVADWDIDPDDAIRGVTWVIDLVEQAIRAGRGPDQSR